MNRTIETYAERKRKALIQSRTRRINDEIQSQIDNGKSAQDIDIRETHDER